MAEAKEALKYCHPSILFLFFSFWLNGTRPKFPRAESTNYETQLLEGGTGRMDLHIRLSKYFIPQLA